MAWLFIRWLFENESSERVGVRASKHVGNINTHDLKTNRYCLQSILSVKINLSSLEVRSATPQVCDMIIMAQHQSFISRLGLRNIESAENLKRIILSNSRSAELVRLDLGTDYSRGGRILLTNDVMSSIVSACPNLKSLSLCRRAEVNDVQFISCRKKFLAECEITWISFGLSKYGTICASTKCGISWLCRCC